MHGLARSEGDGELEASRQAFSRRLDAIPDTPTRHQTRDLLNALAAMPWSTYAGFRRSAAKALRLTTEMLDLEWATRRRLRGWR
jgi:hypothetical protein